MAVFSFFGRSARTRRLATACLSVVENMERGGNRLAPERPRDTIFVPAVVEPLEPKIHLTAVLTAGVSAKGSFVSGHAYDLNLFTTGGYTITKWVVYWNDPNGSASVTYTNGSGFTNPYTVSYTYQSAYQSGLPFGPSAPIKVVATASDGTTTATGYLGTDSNFGSTPSDTGKSLFTESGNSGTASHPVSALDPSTGDIYTANEYKPSSGRSTYEFSVTRSTPSGAVDTNWGSSGTLAFYFDSSNDVPTCIAVAEDGGYVIVGGNCGTGWAVAILETGYQTSTHNYGLVDSQTSPSFQSGHVNALAYDATDESCVVAGDSGTNMAAGLMFPVVSGGVWTMKWGSDTGYGTWSSAVKSYSTGHDSSATTAVNDIGIDLGSTEDVVEGVMVIGGNSDIGGCQQNFAMIGINQSDGSTISAFGTNGVATINIGCTIGCCGTATFDSECSLVSWWNGGDTTYYLTECGQFGDAGSEINDNFAAVRYAVHVTTNVITSVSLDTSFGQYSDGIALGPVSTPYAAVQDPFNGTIYMTGGTGDFYVVAFDSTGAVESSFGNDGVMQIDLGSSGGNSNDFAYSIIEGAEDTDGTTPLIVTGSSNSSYGDVGLVELLPANKPTS